MQAGGPALVPINSQVATAKSIWLSRAHWPSKGQTDEVRNRRQPALCGPQVHRQQRKDVEPTPHAQG